MRVLILVLGVTSESVFMPSISLSDPLPLAQDPLGRIYVGEMGAGRV